jgi:hypothetical protein
VVPGIQRTSKYGAIWIQEELVYQRLLDLTRNRDSSNREHLVAVSFDLEKAYDTAWRYNITKNLQQMPIKERLLRFIYICMSNRSFRVLIGDTMSEKYQQENGVVQGAVLSVNLFLVAANVTYVHG